jgi:hypothetical protein
MKSAGPGLEDQAVARVVLQCGAEQELDVFGEDELGEARDCEVLPATIPAVELGAQREDRCRRST